MEMNEIQENANVDLAEVYRNKRRRKVVNLHWLNLKLEKDIPICFVEGEDSKYYRIRVELITSKEPIFIKCGNKQGVLDIYEKIMNSNDYNEFKLLYFVDTDFDDKTNDQNIYETPCHSIENLYTTEQTFKRILEDEFNLTEEDPDFHKCINIFEERSLEFHQSVLELNAWIAYISRINKTRDKENKIKINLKDLSFKNIAQVNLDKVVPKFELAKIEEKLKVSEKVDSEDLKEVINEFEDNGNYRMIFRGKFELEFFKTLLEKLMTDRNRSSNRVIFKEKGNAQLRLDVNMLSSLAQYAYTPACLIKYIEYIWTREKVVA